MCYLTNKVLALKLKRLKPLRFYIAGENTVYYDIFTVKNTLVK